MHLDDDEDDGDDDDDDDDDGDDDGHVRYAGTFLQKCNWKPWQLAPHLQHCSHSHQYLTRILLKGTYGPLGQLAE